MALTDVAPVLEAVDVHRRFGATTALAGVDFTIGRGRVHALIGENGAGKSTLLRILAGIDRPTSGRLVLDGRETQFESARDAALQGVGLIHQELQLFPDLDVTENIFAGRERRTRWGTVDTAAQVEVTRGVLAKLSHPIPPHTLVGALPLGQQQIVEIARALAHDVRVLLMDEPTSALGPSEVPQLFRVIRDVTSHGVSVVYVSHRLEELLAIADVVTVLRDGRVVGHAPVSEVNVSWIVERMTGRDATRLTPASTSHTGATELRVANLQLPSRTGRTGLHDISFEVRAGEVVGLYGLMGAGRTELFESLLGVHHDASGSVQLSSREVGRVPIAERVAAGLAMVPEDRQVSGLVPDLSVVENATLSSLRQLSTFGHLAPASELRAAMPILDELHVQTPGPYAPITAISGGNQQKVVIARALLRNPRVLLLDEPTRGVDVGAKSEILDTMRRLASRGVAIVFATSDLAEIQAVATRVLVMARGRIRADVDATQATADDLASAASAAPDDGADTPRRFEARARGVGVGPHAPKRDDS